jgi:recombinational DNA repair protein (RecF pathway)
MEPKMQENKDDLCHCCSCEAALDIIYTKYGAKLTLCKSCMAVIVAWVVWKI